MNCYERKKNKKISKSKNVCRKKLFIPSQFGEAYVHVYEKKKNPTIQKKSV